MKKDVMKIAREISAYLHNHCKRVRIAGSIRRKEKHPGDVDIVVIPKSVKSLEKAMRKKGRFVQGGEHESTWMVNGIKVELYYTIPKEFGAALLAYSSKKGSGIGLRMVAKRKGLKLNNHGLFRGQRRVAGRTEKEIYKALGRPYKKPEDR